jgi:hypothetical protein
LFSGLFDVTGLDVFQAGPHAMPQKQVDHRLRGLVLWPLSNEKGAKRFVLREAILKSLPMLPGLKWSRQQKPGLPVQISEVAGTWQKSRPKKHAGRLVWSRNSSASDTCLRTNEMAIELAVLVSAGSRRCWRVWELNLYHAKGAISNDAASCRNKVVSMAGVTPVDCR